MNELMRVLILGNMVNDGYAVAKELRNMNNDVDLAVNSSEYGTGLPEWEEGEIPEDINPHTVHRDEIKEYWTAPKWIRYFDLIGRSPKRKALIGKIRAKLNLLKMIKEYDVVVTHQPYCIYAQFTKIPYTAYDAGWIRYFPQGKKFYDRLARRGYKKSRYIIYTNPDTLEIFQRQSFIDISKLRFIPFAIDFNKYRPISALDLRSNYVNDRDLMLFSPSRQAWAEKGNDKIIEAFAKFVRDVPNCKLVMVAWDIDMEKSKNLVASLGISDKVTWIKPVAKNKLIKYYNAADIIFDQFVLGSWGTTTPEVMSCSKPVLMFYKPEHIIRCFGEEPPILNSYTVDEIYANLLKLANNEDLRREIGIKGRDWVIRTHSPRLVAEKHLTLLNDIV